MPLIGKTARSAVFIEGWFAAEALLDPACDGLDGWCLASWM
jgi:hypothetical protein